MRSAPAKIIAVGLALAVSGPVSGVAVGSPDGHGSVPASAESPDQSYDVTLITGHVARLEVQLDGTDQASLVPGADYAGYHAFTRGSDAYLVPAVAQPALAADTLDLELFNVSALVEQGLDDRQGATLPLIVSYEDAQLGRRGVDALEAPDGARRIASLPSVDSVALTVDKTKLKDFWQDISVPGDTSQERSMGLSRGIDKIWLDAQVVATLDESAEQIGAPVAWERGLTGDGVTIAVLDSGIDGEHRDLEGTVTKVADFTGGDSVVDKAGHGTHVASIAAGSGAASDGRYTGVAPGASLMVGKVLGDDGAGTMSMAIAGMEWAAAGGADVINLSLGGPITPGDDPMSEAVNRLTSRHDVLFVVSAGNYSPWNPGMEFVTSPAAADSALSVGALQRPDSLWNGSRRGRMDNNAIKPEIVAPGFNITAAGSSIAGYPAYVSQTGTSMAAPHVAGVAALLKQQHPDWGAEQLRAALTSTAAPLDSYYTSYQQGSGRVDAARATSHEVYVDQGVLHLGYFARPFPKFGLVATETLTYRNDSSEPATLDLASTLTLDGADAPGESLTVTPSALDLAPDASAEVTVSLDATDLPAGTYSGHVMASSDAIEVRTTVGFHKQDDTVDVTLSAIDRNGDPGTATVRITPYLEHDPRYYPEYIYLSPGQPEHTVRLPEGDYNLWSLVTTFDASGRYTEHESIVGDPAVAVDAPNFEITLDARDAVPVSLITPRPSEPRSMTMSWWRGEPGTTLFNDDTWAWSFNDGEPERVSVTPTEEVDDAPFGLATTFDAGARALHVTAHGKRLDAVQVAGSPIDGRHRLRIADVTAATPGDIADTDLSGKIALIQESGELSHSEQVEAAAAAGAEMVALYSAQPGVFWPEGVSGPVPVLALPLEQGRMLRPAADTHPITLHLRGNPRTPYSYDVSFDETRLVPSDLAYRVRPRDLAKVETRIFTTGTNERGWRLHQSSFTDCACGSSAVADFVPSTGYTRTEYVTARSDVSMISAWQFLFGFPADVLYSRRDRTYARGEKVTEEWLKAPLSPGIPQSDIRAGGRSPVSKRTGDHIYYSLAAMTDSAGHWTPNFSPTTMSSRLYLDGKQIYENGWSLSGSAAVPSEVGTYRLETDVDHDGSLIGLSTQTRTAWTFDSAGAGSDAVLPLIDVDYTDLVHARSGRSALDLSNIAPARRDVRLNMVAAHQLGSHAPPVDEMSVHVSFDDGVTWQEAEVTARSNSSDQTSWAAGYRHPDLDHTSGYVSLRITASDGAGGELEQTLIRAYRIEAQ